MITQVFQNNNKSCNKKRERNKKINNGKTMVKLSNSNSIVRFNSEYENE